MNEPNEEITKALANEIIQGVTANVLTLTLEHGEEKTKQIMAHASRIARGAIAQLEEIPCDLRVGVAETIGVHLRLISGLVKKADDVSEDETDEGLQEPRNGATSKQ